MNNDIALLFGLHIGDGSLSKWKNKSTSKIQEKWTLYPGDNAEFANSVLNFLNKNKLRAKIYPKCEKYFRIDSYKAVEILRKYFLCGDKTKTVDIPKEFFHPPLINYVLKGIFPVTDLLRKETREFISPLIPAPKNLLIVF